MDTLPIELYYMIFKLLPIKDTIHLKRVSKKFYQILSNLKPENLTILLKIDYDNYFLTQLRPFRDYPYSHSLIECHSEELILSSKLKLNLIFKNLKKLSTFFYARTLIDVSPFYNQFTDLEVLYCYNRRFIQNKIVLNLNKLIKLKIEGNHYNYKLNTPKLESLSCLDLYSVEIDYPASIRKLETWFDHKTDITKFRNLEILIVIDNDSRFMRNEIIDKLTNLKELHFEEDEQLDQLIPRFNNRRKGLKFYLFGFDIDLNLEIDQISSENFYQNSSKFIINNYFKSASRVYYTFNLNYNDLIKYGKHLLSRQDFYQKFPKILALKLNDEIDSENDLLIFLSKIKLYRLSIKNCELSRSFYNHLNDYNSRIRQLDLKVNLDYLTNEIDFIFKLINLSRLRIYQKICLNFIINAFNNCISLTEIEFTINEQDNAEFRPGFISVISQNPDDADDLFIEGFIDCFETRENFLIYIKEKRDQFKSNGYIDTRELIYAIGKDLLNNFWIDFMIRNSVRKEIIWISK